VALVKGSLPLVAMVPGKTYAVTFMGTDKRSLAVVAQHSGMGGSHMSMVSKSGMMTIDQATVSNIALSTAALTDPTDTTLTAGTGTGTGQGQSGAT
jgi:hypothetical protein